MKFRILMVTLTLLAVVCGAVSAQDVNVRVDGLIATGDARQQEIEQTVFLPYVAAGGEAAGGEVDVRVEPEAVPGEYLVLWKKSAADDRVYAAQVDPRIVVNGADLLQSMQVHQSNRPRIDKVSMSELDSLTQKDILNDYRNNPDVLAVEPNYIYRSLGDHIFSQKSSAVPNDPDFEQQWGLGISRAFEAWDVTTGSAETVIAIIDSGVALDHPDLVDKLLLGYDFVDDDEFANDEFGHGTHVAGIAAATTGNGIGIAGMCPDCKILPLRALNERGGGSSENVVRAIYHAIDNGADVINLSLGAAQLKSEILKGAVNDAWTAGVFVTCAAGNSGGEYGENELIYPAAFGDCVAVAATTRDDVRADGFSQHGTWIELAAPGQEIYSTFITAKQNTYHSDDGTSMAAPHVAGLAGLLSAQGLSNNQIRQQLCDSADPIVGTGSEWRCGRINALAAVTNDPKPEASATPIPTLSPWHPTATPTPTPTLTPMPEAETDLLPNGGFEHGSTAWFFSDPEIVTQKTAYNQESRHSAELGGENQSTDQIFQDVQVPPNGMLRYNWGALGEDSSDLLRLEIEVLDGSGARFVIDHRDSFGVWYTRRHNLSVLAGKMIRIRFQAITDERDPRVFYVDNVSMTKR